MGCVGLACPVCLEFSLRSVFHNGWAGEQIDRTVNSTFIPNPGGDAGTGALRPAYSRHEASYWAHGWSAGLEFRW